MTKTIKYSFLLAPVIMIVIGCKKKDALPTVPTLTTTAVSNITATTATSGGTINSNGGAVITASGIAWSKTNNTPTITNDTTKGTTASGSFISELKNLDPSATYYIRAYATNSVGTGYGNVVTFGSGNAAPEARNVAITGNKNVAAILTSTYTYFDFENNPESATAFQWYIANDTIGATVTPIAGATANTYTVAAADLSKFLKVGVTAKSSAGTSPGIEAKSYWVGPIGAETVTFTYNGQSVTYGVITSSVTGKKWLDRNLGALQVATANDDYLAYGDLFQWGRAADGHQLITWTAANAGTGVNGTTSTLSSTDTPGSNLFILNGTNVPYDWRSPQNDNLWQGVSGTNNPCPSGWRIPNDGEWYAEIAGGNYVGLGHLKITATGFRRFSDGVIPGGSLGAGAAGYYWSSSPAFTTNSSAILFWADYAAESDPNVNWARRAQGSSCRCIKN